MITTNGPCLAQQAATLEPADGAISGEWSDETQSLTSFQPVDVKPWTSADLPPSNPFGIIRASRTSIVFNPDWRASRDQYRAIVEREAHAFGIPAPIVDAVMAVESSYNPSVIGLDGEIGLMQVLPSTARMLGFSGPLQQLSQPEINIHYGTSYLAGAWQRAGGDLCTAAMKYRAGHGETRFSYLSVDYCLRVRNHLVAQGVVVTGSIPAATFGRSAAPSPSNPRRVRTGRFGGVNFAALNTQFRAMTDRKSSQAVP